MNAPVVIRIGGASLARAWFEPICSLYDAVFSPPPQHWEEGESDAHRTRLNNLLANPTFAIAIAISDGIPIGFCYGYSLPRHTIWWTGFTGPLPDGLAEEWDGRTFAVIDLAVATRWQGSGHGRKLLETLLGSRPEERATLAVQPQIEANHRFYEHLGWEFVGSADGMVDGSLPHLDIYTRPLRGTGR